MERNLLVYWLFKSLLSMCVVLWFQPNFIGGMKSKAKQVIIAKCVFVLECVGLFT
jgi:hypothetical protein